MPDDGPTLFGEIRRMARTSGAVGGIAARMAGARLGIATDKQRHAEDLRQILGGLKGPLMKVAQFFSTIPDALPEEYADELANLQSNAPPMGWNFVRRRMRAELGEGWEKKFTDFSHTASHAASLGQVHKATLPDGRIVACKLQYPDMASTVEADLRQLRLALSVYRKLDSTIQQDDVYAELAERLREELDYTREAAQMRLYHHMMRAEPDVTVPTPVMAFCTDRLLTMTWLDGRKIQEVLAENPSQEQRNRMAAALFRAYYTAFYHYGVIHGDPHLGNYQVRADGGINLLDFGAIRVFPPRFVSGVIMLYEAMRDRDDEKAMHAYQLWGFPEVTAEKLQVLNTWARFLYEPLLEDAIRPIQRFEDPNHGRNVAMEVHAGLKRTGGVRPPREFVLLDRSAIGLGSVFLRLRAELNWSAMLREIIADFSEENLRSRQAEALALAGLTVPEHQT